MDDSLNQLWSAPLFLHPSDHHWPQRGTNHMLYCMNLRMTFGAIVGFPQEATFKDEATLISLSIICCLGIIIVRHHVWNLSTTIECAFAALPLATGLTSTFENGFETVAAQNGSYVPRQAPPFRLQSPPTSAQSPPTNSFYQPTPVNPPYIHASHPRINLQSQPTMLQSQPTIVQFPPPMLQSTPPTQHSVSPMPYSYSVAHSSQPLPELIPRVMTGSEMPR